MPSRRAISGHCRRSTKIHISSRVFAASALGLPLDRPTSHPFSPRLQGVSNLTALLPYGLIWGQKPLFRQKIRSNH